MKKLLLITLITVMTIVTTSATHINAVQKTNTNKLIQLDGG